MSLNRVIHCGVISSSVSDAPIAQPTPIRPYQSPDGFALYQLYLQNLTLHSPIHRPASVITGSTQWSSPSERKSCNSPEVPHSTTSPASADTRSPFTWPYKPAKVGTSRQQSTSSLQEDSVQILAYPVEDELEDPSICSICGDRSSGLHYGIYTCEGCKGFFKRTVQNKREYSCVAGSSDCVINKQHRNRCQSCRFKKCLDQGMVLEAVREDRMPGGRNGSAIYNLYKCKSHKQRRRVSVEAESEPVENATSMEETAVKRRCEEEIRPTAKNMIQDLIEIDRIDRLINLRGLRVCSLETDEIPSACQRLSRIGDEIVEQLVEWTKLLPFYPELPVEVHTHLLTQRWAELVMLSACFYATSMSTASSEENTVSTTTIDGHEEVSFVDPVINIQLLQRRLTAVMGKPIPMEHVIKEAGPLVERFTCILNSFSKLNLSPEAYVCIKAITLLHYSEASQAALENNNMVKESQVRKVTLIQDQFVKLLQIHLAQQEQSSRLCDILQWLPQLQSASNVLLHSKMFYVPFLICKNPRRMAGLQSDDTDTE